ncbi:MAG: hypothetical protein BWY10_02154 [Chloroflexi bacterium ADurb.Bin180]|nr:MAG: hypothetical protein BWY10_02154 [Chloroflexi bacterium ADurb.Bin180]
MADERVRLSGSSRYPIARWLLVLVCVLLVLAAGYKAVRIVPHARAVYFRARVMRQLAGKPEDLLHPQRLPFVREQLALTRDDLRAIRREIAFLYPLLERLDWIPRIGPDIAAAPALLDLGIAACDAGWWSLLGLEPVWDAVSRETAPRGKGALELATPVLVVARPRFEAASTALQKARPTLQRLNRLELSPRLARYQALLNAYWPVVEGGLLLAQDLPELLGEGRTVNYLLIAQNDQELRPTGGFISGAGLLQISAGKIVSMTFQDSYAVDALCDASAFSPAPSPLREYMWAPVLVFRDANWSPDLPTSAATLRSLYRRCQGVDVDGVVTLDIEAVRALLGALGPLQPEGYPEPVSNATLTRYINEYWTNPLRLADSTDEQKGDWWLHRKDFMSDLLKAALTRLTSDPASLELAPLGVALLRALQGRHIQATLSSPGLDRSLLAAGWNGELKPVAGDYLMVVDANVGFRKVNPLIEQWARYQVDATVPDAPRARLVLRYANHSAGKPECVAGSHYEDSYAEMVSGCYWDYVRVYVPYGSRLLGLKGADSTAVVESESGKTVLGFLWVIAPGQVREIELEYQLPPLNKLVLDNEIVPYRLLVQKQAGSASYPFVVEVAGQGWSFSSSRSTPAACTGQEVQVNLDSDAVLVWGERQAATAQSRTAALTALLLGLGLMGAGWLVSRRAV